MAVPLQGDDYATANSRDVYLREGRWVKYGTGKVFTGPAHARRPSFADWQDAAIRRGRGDRHRGGIRQAPCQGRSGQGRDGLIADGVGRDSKGANDLRHHQTGSASSSVRCSPRSSWIQLRSSRIELRHARVTQGAALRGDTAGLDRCGRRRGEVGPRLNAARPRVGRLGRPGRSLSMKLRDGAKLKEGGDRVPNKSSLN